MIPGSFDYCVATSLSEAIGFLDRYGDEAKILAGGHSLIPLLRFRLASPAILIDINSVRELEYIHEADGFLHIGALTREAELDSSPLIRQHYPILFETASNIADPSVRNWATVGGNIAHADPANDHPATMLALNAQLLVQSSAAERVIPINQFFVDSAFETTLASNEMLVEIRIPIPTVHSGGAYFKLERKAGDFAVVGVAAYLTLDDAGLITYAGIALTNSGPYPIKATTAEQSLLGKPLDETAIQLAANLTAAAAQPISDNRGPAEYKRSMVRTLCVRALRKSLTRATGGA